MKMMRIAIGPMYSVCFLPESILPYSPPEVVDTRAGATAQCQRWIAGQPARRSGGHAPRRCIELRYNGSCSRGRLNEAPGS